MNKLIIDGNSLLNRAFYGVRPLSTKEGLPTNALFGFANILFKYAQSGEYGELAVAFDRREPTFRHLRYDGYKATRKPMPEELAAQLPVAKELLACWGFRVLELAGYEADDLLGTYAARCEADGDSCSILTGDRDALQLVSDRVSVLIASASMGKSEVTVYTPAAILEKYGVTPRQLIEVKALMGDTSDNIPGVPGVGEKTALNLIATYGSLDGVYARLEEQKGALKTKLEQGRESALLSRELAEICRTAPLEQAGGPAPALDRGKLYTLLRRLEFEQLIARLGLSPADSAAPVKADENGELTLPEDGRLAFLEHGGVFAVSDGRACRTYDSFEGLLTWLRLPGVKPVLHHGKALLKRCLEQHIALSPAFDTALAAYLLDPADGERPLASLCNATASLAPEDEPASLAAAMLPLAQAQERLLAEKGLEKLFWQVELPLMSVLADMELRGIRVDTQGLTLYGRELEARAEEVAQRVYLYAGEPFNILSPKQLGEVLFQRLGLRAVKKTKTGYSTDAESLQKLAGAHPIVEEVLEYRRLTKLKSTYTDGLCRAADAENTVHTVFQQTVTHTGRLSSTEPNLQNLPVRTPEGLEIRRFLVARPGHVLLDADYSQIELRILAHIANDEQLLSAFAQGEDIHTKTASEVFRVPRGQVTSEMRKYAKAVNFGIVYGISDFSLSQDLGVSRAEAKSYIERYFAAYPGVAAYLKQITVQAAEDGFVRTEMGRIRYVPELASSNANLRAFGARVAMNTPIQGLAADIIKVAMVNTAAQLKQAGLQARLVLQIHDELVVEAPLQEQEQASRILQQEMESAFPLRGGLVSEVIAGENLAALKG